MVYRLCFPLNLVVAHDGPAIEFAVFRQFLAFVASVIFGFVVFLRALQRIVYAFDTSEYPEIIIDRKTC